MKKGAFYITILLVAWTATILLYFWFIQSDYFDSFSIWARKNLILFYVSLLFAKVLAIVWPPLPGSFFTLGAIPFIGWVEAYVIDTAGSMMGASIAYFLGYKYGYQFLKKLFSADTVEKIKQIKIRRDREIESVFIGRMAGAGNIMELICYGAGVLRVGFLNFLVASFLANLVFMPAYYIGGSLLHGGNIIIGLLFTAVTLLLFWKIKGRYIE